MNTILIIEDEPKVARFIQRGLNAEGFQSDVALSGSDGLRMALEKPYDVITVDLLLPKMDGFTVIENFRKKNLEAAILILSAKDSLNEKLKGFNLGGDDYLSKPFAFEELLARINALLRRKSSPLTIAKIRYGSLELDIDARKVFRDGERIDLTNLEFKLLEYLIRNMGKVCTRVELSANVWDESFDRETNILDVYIMYLRKKIEKDESQPIIKTVRGLGYMVERL